MLLSALPSVANFAPRYGFRLTVFLIASTLLTACESDTEGPPPMSLEEAKQVVAEFQDVSYTPPARSINDIIKAFGSPPELKAEHCTEGSLNLLQVVRNNLEQSLPRHNSYSSSGFSIATVNIRKLLRLADDAFVLGMHYEAIKFMQSLKSQIPDVWRNSIGKVNFSLAKYYLLIGNTEAAKKEIRGGHKNFGVFTHGDIEDYPDEREFWLDIGRSENLDRRSKPHFLIGNAALAQVNGNYKKAEILYKMAIRLVKKWNENENTRISLEFDMPESDLSEVLARQDRLAEAEALARKILNKVIKSRRFSYYYGLNEVINSPRFSYFYGLTDLKAAFLAERLAGILYEQGRYGEAEWLSRRAIVMYQSLCAPPESMFLARARQRMAEALVAQGRLQEALEVFETLRKDLQPREPEIYDRLFKYNADLALALLNTGHSGDALELLRAAVAEASDREGEDSIVAAEARGLFGMALVSVGEIRQAIAEFRRAVPVIAAHLRHVETENRELSNRSRRLVQIIESYMAALTAPSLEGKRVSQDVVAEVFELSELARGSAVAWALSAADARAAAKDPRLADLVRREQDLRNQITALNALVVYQVSLPTHQRDEKIAADLNTRLVRLRSARAALVEEIDRNFADYAGLINPRPATLAAARILVRPDEALVTIYLGKTRAYVWAIPHSGEAVFAAVDVSRDNVADMVGVLRIALDPNARTLGGIPEYDLDTAYRLYEALLKPVEAGWKQASSLLVVPHGSLGYLPLSVLPIAPNGLAAEREPLFSNYGDVPWLASTHAVTMLPSVASLKTLRRSREDDPERRPFVGFGDPWFSAAQAAEAMSETPVEPTALATRGMLAIRGLPIRLRKLPEMDDFDSAQLAQLPRLPDTADEVRSIALALNADLTRDVFTGKAANEAQVKTMELSGYRVLAFATHGLVPGDLDGLTQPALALSAPEVAAVDGDGLLTMGEILGLKLNADWVVLSACNTAAAEGKGAEAVSGLGRAFFYAGTRALLVSNWPVETTSAKALTTDLFRRQAADPTLSRAEALRQAMQALIDGPGYVDDRGRSVFSYAHPIFWAPFTLIGDGGGNLPGA